MIEIRYGSIRSMDISNGEGVGVALFVQGCPSPHCKNCFNPETWDFNGGKEWTREIEDKFINLAKKTYIKRISILGGEALADDNLDDILKLVNRICILLPEKRIWLYTGYTWESIMNYETSDTISDISFEKRKIIISMCDVVVDGKYIDDKRDISLKFRGSSNQRVIDIKKSIKEDKIILYCD